MNLHEETLKKIIKGIEKYAVIIDVQICNNSIIICPPNPRNSTKPVKVIELDLNRAKDFMIKFKLGDIKEKI